MLVDIATWTRHASAANEMSLPALTQFIENYEAPACGVVQDIRRFTELHEESRLSSQDTV